MSAENAGRTTWRDTMNGAASHLNSPASHRATRAAALAVPVLLVNAVAFIGQYGYLRDHLPWREAGIVMAAVALESIAVYLQWHAHLAQLANDSALRLRLASYGLALVIAAMNYSHYAGPHWSPTVAAVMLGLMSAISPWLWAIHSRRVSRDELMARGLIEEHSVRLGATRWMWHLIRSTRVMFRATWVGENSPRRAIDAFGDKYGTLVPAGQGGTPAHEPVAQPAQRASVPAGERAAIGATPWAGPPQDVPAAAVPVPAVHSASARLVAVAELPHKPSQEVIDAAELALAGMAVEQLPSVRAIARDMLGDPQQRRLADKLRKARVAAEMQKPGASVIGMDSRPERPAEADNTIAWPQQFQPGGVTG